MDTISATMKGLNRIGGLVNFIERFLHLDHDTSTP